MRLRKEECPECGGDDPHDALTDTPSGGLPLDDDIQSPGEMSPDDREAHGDSDRGDARELLLLVRAGDEAAFERLLGLYEPMINSTVKRYTPAWQDTDDARQEALTGFYRAAMKFDPSQPGVAFGLYAKVCVTNAIISHIREVNRRLDGAGGSFEYDDYLRYGETEREDPSEDIVDRENVAALQELIRRSLSEFENRVWDMYVAGAPSSQIAAALGREERAIDNALYRIRHKLRRQLESGGTN